MSLATEILIRVWFTYESPMLNLSNTILAYCLSFFFSKYQTPSDHCQLCYVSLLNDALLLEKW